MNSTPHFISQSESLVICDADSRALTYLKHIETRRVFPSPTAIAALDQFDRSLPDVGENPLDVIALMDEIGSPATVASNGPNYFGFVIGASLPIAAAADRLALAWDQCASSGVTSPIADKIERVAARWLLDILELPPDSAVGFGTSAAACTLTCLTTARRELLRKKGWDFDRDGLDGAPRLRVVISNHAHVTMKKALRILGIGLGQIEYAPTDSQGVIDPTQLPWLDDATIFCLQAGEVNTGSFDPFDALIPRAKAAGAWTHVDGAFGLWARAGSNRDLTKGIEGADSWTTDGHKWLNTPYDSAMAICRHAEAMSQAMSADAVYASNQIGAQKNFNLEFSRRARGIPIWAALCAMGREGVRQLIDRHCAQAQRAASELRKVGYQILNDVVLNQVLVRAGDDNTTLSIVEAAQKSGKAWFGQTIWQDRPAFRLSFSSWRTEDRHVDALINLLTQLYVAHEKPQSN